MRNLASISRLRHVPRPWRSAVTPHLRFCTCSVNVDPCEAKSKHSVKFNGSLARIANRGCKYKSRLVYGEALITGRSCIRSRSVYSRVLHNVTRLHTMWCHFATKSTFSLPVLARRSTTPHKSSAQGICACPFQNAGDFKVHIGCSGTLTAYTYAARAVDTNLMDPIRDLRRRPSSV